MDLERIQEVIVLDQLMSSAGVLYSHSERTTEHHFVQKGVSLIPPGIGESFMQAGIENVDVITGFDKEYDPFYGSSLNTVDESDFPAILEQTSTLIHELSWKLGVNQTIEVDEHYLTNLLSCFAVNGTCSIIEQTLEASHVD